MATPIDPGTLECWLSDQLWLDGTRTKENGSGSLECWFSDSLWPLVYTSNPADLAVSVQDCGKLKDGLV